MNAALNTLLQPEVLNTVEGLELMARITVEGFISGGNRSLTIGAGQEFSQYRAYEPGDDLRQLDWKMYARSERYYIKQAEIETNITVRFVLDTSRSMAHTENKMSKLLYAKVLAAALAYLARKQSDHYALYALNSKDLRVVPAAFDHQQFFRFLNELVRTEAQGQWRPGADPEKLIGRRGKDLIIFLTDLYDADEDLLQFISRLKTTRNEVIVFQLMGRAERQFDYNDTVTFEDLETGARVKVSTAEQRAAYQQRIEGWLTRSRDRLLEKGITFQPVSMADPAGEVLAHFLNVRKKLLR
ncbi:MAG: DUF58 domain-containing protein [Cyclobacteriaceae bacterium]|nr:DUF58 domain-containing protein [Cyclobacteriaceae bacterium]